MAKERVKEWLLLGLVLACVLIVGAIWYEGLAPGALDTPGYYRSAPARGARPTPYSPPPTLSAPEQERVPAEELPILPGLDDDGA